MPVVHRESGFSVRLYLPPREHGPAHVHVVKDDTEIVISLGEEGSPPEVIEVYGMTNRDALRAYRLVEANREQLAMMWREYHG